MERLGLIHTNGYLLCTETPLTVMAYANDKVTTLKKRSDRLYALWVFLLKRLPLQSRWNTSTSSSSITTYPLMLNQRRGSTEVEQYNTSTYGWSSPATEGERVGSTAKLIGYPLKGGIVLWWCQGQGYLSTAYSRWIPVRWLLNLRTPYTKSIKERIRNAS